MPVRLMIGRVASWLYLVHEFNPLGDSRVRWTDDFTKFIMDPSAIKCRTLDA